LTPRARSRFEGRSMIIYDRWGGRFQRASYDAEGQPTLTRLLYPF
jgi:hypothetical protein